MRTPPRDVTRVDIKLGCTGTIW